MINIFKKILKPRSYISYLTGTHFYRDKNNNLIEIKQNVYKKIHGQKDQFT